MHVKRNRIIAYFLIIVLLMIFLCVILSPSTTITFIKSKGGNKNDFYDNYENHKVKIRKKVDEFYTYTLYYEDENPYSVEHIFARAWSRNISGDERISNDYYNLRLCNKKINEIRNNKGFSSVQHDEFTQVVLNGKLYGWKNADYFEPLDEYKGDIARTLLYIYYNYNLKEEDIKNYFSVKEMKSWANIDKLSNEEKEFNKKVKSDKGYSNLFLERQTLINFI